MYDVRLVVSDLKADGCLELRVIFRGDYFEDHIKDVGWDATFHSDRRWSYATIKVYTERGLRDACKEIKKASDKRELAYHEVHEFQAHVKEIVEGELSGRWK